MDEISQDIPKLEEKKEKFTTRDISIVIFAITIIFFSGYWVRNVISNSDKIDQKLSISQFNSYKELCDNALEQNRQILNDINLKLNGINSRLDKLNSKFDRINNHFNSELNKKEDKIIKK